MMASTTTRSLRVLVAEDNEDHLFFITRALAQYEGATFEVSTVRDGASALDYLNQRNGYEDAKRPHLVILDLRMPRMGGLEVLEALRADEELCGIPVAVLSTSDRSEDIDESYRRGTNTYVVKEPSLEGITRGLQAMSEFWTEVARIPEPPQ